LKTGNRTIFGARMIVVPIYIAAIAGAEAIGVFIGVVPGALCQAILTLTLLSHYVLMDRAPYRRILPVLALAPLLRLLSLTMPIRHLSQIYWYALVGTPLLIAAALTARLLDLSKTCLGLRTWSWRPQILIASSGLPLSMAAFLLLRPEAPIARLDWREMAIGSLILIVFTGFTEEILFRGMLQQVANEALGQAGILCSSILFAVMYIGSLSLSYVLFIGLVGLFFGWCVNQTGSIWGVVLAHSMLSIGMMLVWPFLWG
jgi:membrane protease YdiL (CAAX protease family)